MPGKPIDRTGQRFGCLLVIERAPDRPGSAHAHWLCQCDCGNRVVVRSNGLGTTSLSCGCLRATPAIRQAARLKTPAKRREEIAASGGIARWAEIIANKP